MTDKENKKLESICGGPLKMNQDGTLDLRVINGYLEKQNLKLEIAYIQDENKYGFALYNIKE